MSQLGEIKMKKQKALLTSPIVLSDLLPDNTKDFYRYHGSLTTPTCEETVIWTVFTTPIAVSETQVEYFLKITLIFHPQLIKLTFLYFGS